MGQETINNAVRSIVQKKVRVYAFTDMSGRNFFSSREGEVDVYCVFIRLRPGLPHGAEKRLSRRVFFG